ncbi:MAG: FAD-dependent oxidoreductase [Deltaproteobacteria bacterium]|nr:FAD-dependent oxidoreductase [Deltaproteobacteria bacterium]
MTGNQYDLMVVGTGPAGLTAAIYGQRMGLNVVVFGDTPGGNLYMIETLMNYPGFAGGITGTQFGVAVYMQAQEEGTVFPMTLLEKLSHTDNRFVGIDRNAGEYFAPVAIVASGRKPKALEVPNADKPGIHTCSTCDGPLFRDKNATLAVIGGDNIAGRHSLTLSKFADRVILIHEGDRLKIETVIQKEIESKDNIDVFLNMKVVGFTGLDTIDGITVSTEKEKKEMPVDGVFTAFGWHPNIEMLKIPVETTSEGYIKTDEKLMTSFPGLFAAGDVRDTDMWQVITACADGARAAKYASEFLEEDMENG